MNSITKIQNLINNCVDCAGIDPDTVMATLPKSGNGVDFYVDLSIENFGVEDLAYLVGFLAQSIGMKNVWLDTYPKSGRAHLELVFTQDFLAQ